MEENILNVIKFWLSGEISNLIKVWLVVYISLCYCYLVSKIVPKGIARLILFFPVICLFLYLPLNLSSVHLGGITAFFVAWLANFKLIMFAFQQGPLSNPALSIQLFLAISCLPIKIQQHNPQTSDKTEKTDLSPEARKRSLLIYGLKGLLLALFFKVYNYSENIHPKIILVIYCFHIYFSLELILAITAASARGLFGIELEAQFNEPILSTSLQDFWGRRWNLMVTRILRPTVYDPVLNLASKFLGRNRASLPAIMATFIVSGLMHELMFYYLGREKPTWEVTSFFLLHGVCLMVEVTAKKALRDICHMPRIVGTILTIGFVMITGSWLFFPQFLRSKSDVRGFEEFAALGGFAKDFVKALTAKSNTRF